MFTLLEGLRVNYCDSQYIRHLAAPSDCPDTASPPSAVYTAPREPPNPRSYALLGFAVVLLSACRKMRDISRVVYKKVFWL